MAEPGRTSQKWFVRFSASVADLGCDTYFRSLLTHDRQSIKCMNDSILIISGIPLS